MFYFVSLNFCLCSAIVRMEGCHPLDVDTLHWRMGIMEKSWSKTECLPFYGLWWSLLKFSILLTWIREWEVRLCMSNVLVLLSQMMGFNGFICFQDPVTGLPAWHDRPLSPLLLYDHKFLWVAWHFIVLNILKKEWFQMTNVYLSNSFY